MEQCSFVFKIGLFVWYSENIQKLYGYADSVIEKLTLAVLTGRVFTIITPFTTDKDVDDTMGVDVTVVVTAGT